MKRYWAEKWIKDLEARGRRQTTKVLTDGHGAYCCLGRLCVVAGLQPDQDGNFEGMRLSLPKSVMRKTGIRHDEGALPEDVEIDGQGCLSGLNDSGKSFKQIAKVIRKHWRHL